MVTGQVVKVVKTLYQSDVSLRAKTTSGTSGYLHFGCSSNDNWS